MTSFLLGRAEDRSEPREGGIIAFTVDGVPATAIEGQTIAGALLAGGRTAWRTTAVGDEPRGVFCGIGVCFDCLVTVGDTRDVRACMRRVCEGDVVQTQHDRLPEAHA